MDYQLAIWQKDTMYIWCTARGPTFPNHVPKCTTALQASQAYFITLPAATSSMTLLLHQSYTERRDKGKEILSTGSFPGWPKWPGNKAKARSFIWVWGSQRPQTFGPSSAAFLSPPVRNWIGGRTARTQTDARMDGSLTWYVIVLATQNDIYSEMITTVKQTTYPSHSMMCVAF